MAAVIGVLTGLVVDYIVIPSFVMLVHIRKVEFRDTSQDNQEWYTNHKDGCAVNYRTSQCIIRTPFYSSNLWNWININTHFRATES